MGAAAPIGAGAYLAGTAADAYGQHKAMSAMRDVWGDSTATQRGYDDQLAAKAGALVDQVNPTSALGLDRQQQTRARTDAAVGNAAKAVAKQGNRRAGNAEGKAVAAQRSSGVLARALADGRLQAILAGLQAGGQNIDMLGRQYGLDSSIIRGDARQAAALTPLFERAAGMEGSEWRQLGQLGKIGGMAGMMAGMTAPSAAAGGAGTGGMWETGPSGGTDAFMSSSQYAAGGGGPSIFTFTGR